MSVFRPSLPQRAGLSSRIWNRLAMDEPMTLERLLAEYEEDPHARDLPTARCGGPETTGITVRDENP